MKFNFRTSWDFPPIFTIGDSDPLKCVTETKILGIILSSDLKWSHHVDFMCKKALKKTWLLRRLKILDLEIDILLDFYLKEIRSILEYGVPVWHSGLSRILSNKIERVQKICVSIILCNNTEKHISYIVGCTLLGIEPLFLRRTELCIRFIQKTSLEPSHSDMFTKRENTYNTRQNKSMFKELSSRNKRFYDSPLCYLTRLLNSYPVKQNTNRQDTHTFIATTKCNFVDNRKSTVLPVLLHSL